jgi:DNA polymerase III subunit gamma/tau
MSVKPHGTGDLYHKYRPMRYNEVVGHDSTIQSIKAATTDVKSQAFMLTGDSGTGKTTTARIMALAVNCKNPNDGEPCLDCANCKSILSGNCPDMLEVNAANTRGIDAVREMCANMGFAPMMLTKRVYILDEAHQLTKDAQNTLLKYLEEVPKHVIIILCSTEPKGFLKAVRTRCQISKFELLARGDMLNLLKAVTKQEDEDIPQEILSLIINTSEGSPRNALVRLQQVLQLESRSKEAVTSLLSISEDDPNAIKLCFALTSEQARWTTVAKVFNDVKSLGPPALGMTMAGYFRNKLLKATDYRIAYTLSEQLALFLTPFGTGKPGESQLVSALFKAYVIGRSAKAK